MFESTREYHNARKEWEAKNPALPYSVSELAPRRFTFLEDMDVELKGKNGVFFPFAQCFYSFRDVIADESKKRPHNGGVGYAKLLVPHYGPLFILVDDLQGTANNDLCLTKHMEMQVLPGFRFDQDYYYEAWVRKTITKARIETETWMDLRDVKTGMLVAKSSGMFVQNQTVLASMNGQFGKNKQEVWDSLANLHLKGKSYADPEMSFVLHLPRVEVTEIPSWWDASVRRQPAKPSPFEGRFEIYNVEISPQAVRAVLRAGLTAEGPPGLFHGGGAASAVIEVLMNKLPSFQLSKYHVKFRQPIRLNVPFVVEIIQQHHEHQGEWKASILNFDRQLLQEITLCEATSSKY